MWYINPRKKLRQLSVRMEPTGATRKRYKDENDAGAANGQGATIFVYDEAEPDRAAQLLIRNVDEAMEIMELMARFINERTTVTDLLTGRPFFHYRSSEVDRLDTGETSSIHVRFDNRDEDANLWPSTSRHMSLPYRYFKMIRAIMSQIPD